VFVTVKLTGLLVTPLTFTVTETVPTARLGTVAVIELLPQAVMATEVTPKSTMPDPWVVPNADPLIVTDLPGSPVVGLMDVIATLVLAVAWFDGADSPALFTAVTK
jgi:hypothetical protein